MPNNIFIRHAVRPKKKMRGRALKPKMNFPHPARIPRNITLKNNPKWQCRRLYIAVISAYVN